MLPRNAYVAVIGLGCTLLLLGGPAPMPRLPLDVGGLTAEDFELISLNGFDPEDNGVDFNDYAWSVEYFEPDGAAPALPKLSWPGTDHRE